MEERSREILKEVISVHIETGEPVGSRTVAKRMNFKFSPATIRNVMADLEEMGYLAQPHTSAGRVPTDLGYRYYVDHLMSLKPVTEIMERLENLLTKEMEKAKDVEDILKIASRFLSKYTDHVGLLFIPKIKVLSVKSVNFVRLAEKTVLVVFISESGIVQHKVVKTEEDYSQEQLNRFSSYINSEFSGKSLAEVKKALLEQMKEEKQEYDNLFAKAVELSKKAMSILDKEGFEVHLEGTSNILKHKEFVENVEKLKEIFKAFEEKSKIVKLIDKCLKEEGVTVIIGKEAQAEEFKDLALILTPCIYKERSFGTLGLVAPKRVDYSFAIPLVQKTSEYIKEILSD